MLYNYFKDKFINNKLTNSWIISGSSPEKNLNSILVFAKDFLGLDTNHPDLYIIRSNDKYITIDQIRNLNKFIFNTPLSKYKLVVIVEADKMNINSANSCLKILEDCPQETNIIILLTERHYNLPVTIRSRCHKIFISNEQIKTSANLLAKDLDLITQDNWIEFTNNIIAFLGEKIKKTDNQSDIGSLLAQYNEINRIINQTIKYNMDYKHSYILIKSLLEKVYN